MDDEERINALDRELTTLGPETHALKTKTLPDLIKQCRILRGEGHHQAADALADRIEKLTEAIKSREQQLYAIERELYSLRAKQNRRKMKLRP